MKVVGLLAALTLVAAPVARAQALWRVERPVQASRTGAFADKRITESSGVAPSRRTPGVLWTHGDSGEPAYLFATDTAGTVRGTFGVTGARNRDWEDIALGPCGRSTCVYLADTGDNNERRSAVALYRVPEPRLPERRPKHVRPTAPAEVLTFRYPDGPHDVEAMWVAPNEDVHLVSKGRTGRIRHYRVRAAGWASRRPATAERLEALPLPVRSRLDYVTGAALSPDGRMVVVRSYTTAYFFAVLANGRLALPAEPRACDVRDLGLQGEGVGWLDRNRLVLTSERAILPAGTIAIARCALPSLPEAG